MKKSATMKRISAASNKFISGAGNVTQDVLKNTSELVNDLSKSISKIDFSGIYKDTRKSILKTARISNKRMNKAVRKFRKSNLYYSITNAPVYFTLLSKWSTVKWRKFKRSTMLSYVKSRKWVLKNMPKVELWAERTSSNFGSWVGIQYPKITSYLKANYPKIESFVFTGLPIYRAAFGKA